jgi:3'-5' exoribonuclease
MLDQSDLIDLQKSNSVDHFLMIRKLELRNTKAGKEYLSLELGDKSGSLSANVWSDTKGFDKISNKGDVGMVVKVLGTIEEYQGNSQLKIKSIRLTEIKDGVNPQDFLPKSIRNPDEMEEEFLSRIKMISDDYLRELLTNVFKDDRLEKFKKAPAGKSWHHAYIHGLIEHTLEMIRICDLMCDIHVELNRDLLITGTMLHDFGKTEELSYDSAFEYSDKGKLIGHIVICASMIEAEAKQIPGFPEELKNLVIHLVLSHQGKLEYASPVIPKTLEAIALYQADELSAKVNAYKSTLKSEKSIRGNWTKFIHLAQTDLYKHEEPDELNEETKESLFD